MHHGGSNTRIQLNRGQLQVTVTYKSHMLNVAINDNNPDSTFGNVQMKSLLNCSGQFSPTCNDIADADISFVKSCLNF